MKLRVGDQVIVNTGKDKGKSGTISKIFLKDNRVLVTDINKKIKHVKGRDGQPGERLELAVPIQISNVSLLDPKTKKASRIGYGVDKAGNKTRISKASGEVVPLSHCKKAKNNTTKVKA